MASLLASLPVFQGQKPEVPFFRPVDAQTEQLLATHGNIASFGDTSKLAAMTNQFNQEQLLQMLRTAIPDYDNIMQQGSSLVQSYMKGELPEDVRNQIGRTAAERSLAGGYAGSGMARNLEARDLGLTSLQLTQTGLSAAERWMSGATARAVPQMFDVTSMFISPQLQISTSFAESNRQWERDWLGAKINAAPEPWAAHMGQALDDIADTVLSMAASYGGSMMGGGGGGQTGGGQMGGGSMMMPSSGGGGGGGGFQSSPITAPDMWSGY